MIWGLMHIILVRLLNSKMPASWRNEKQVSVTFGIDEEEMSM